MPFSNLPPDYNGGPVPIPQPQALVITQEQDTFFKKIAGQVKDLSGTWSQEGINTKERRALRQMEVDVAARREQGSLDKDEIIIPIHVIDDNITKELAQYIAYLVTSRNAAVFKPKLGYDEKQAQQTLNFEVPAQYFTNLVRFPSWEVPFYKVLDGAETHGWDALEVVFDETKPGHFNHRHIAHENLWFPEDTEDLQESPIVVQNIMVTRETLEGFPEINKDELEKLFKDSEKMLNVTSKKAVQKVYYRKDGLVNVCWMSFDKGAYFLRDPKPLFLGRMKISRDTASGIEIGRQPIYETRYPIAILQYNVSENDKLMSIKGRAFKDRYTQEAATSMVSSVVNSWHRSQYIMGSPANPDEAAGNGIKQLDIKIGGSRIYNKKMEFWSMPKQDGSGMQIIEGLLTRNKAETSQVDFAARNREDSRKTAKEISVAQSQAALLSSVQVTLFGIFLREVFTIDWSIASSQLEQGLLKYKTLPPEYLAIEYDLFAAGDTEVIQREETLQKLQQVFPVLMQVSSMPMTPVVAQVLMDILTAAFPNRAGEYIKALQQSDPRNGVIQALSGIVKGVVADAPNIIPLEQHQALTQILAQADQMTGVSQAQPQEGQPTDAQ